MSKKRRLLKAQQFIEIQMDENQEKYKKFQKLQDKILSETDFQRL